MQEVYKAIMRKKKDQDEMDPMEKHAMMGVLKDIHGMASNDMGHDIKGLKKISVMSDSDAGMKEGLKKAGEIEAHKQGHSMSDDDADRVSADMHQESQRHKLNKKSDMTDQDDAMANPMGDEEADSDKAMEGYAEGGNVLDANARKHIASKNFAGPDRSYPIEDAAHARNALARVAQHGSPELQAQVRAKVHSKYPGIGKANGGMINPGQYGEAQADVVGTPHQHRQDHGMNTQYARPTINKEYDPYQRMADGGSVEHQHDQTMDFMEDGPMEMRKEWGPGKNYAEGGMIHPGAFGEAQADVVGTPHQRRQDHGFDTGYAGTEMKKEMGTGMPHLQGNGSDMHNGKPLADQDADDLGDLDDSEIDMLIKHLQARRKG